MPKDKYTDDSELWKDEDGSDLFFLDLELPNEDEDDDEEDFLEYEEESPAPSGDFSDADDTLAEAEDAPPAPEAPESAPVSKPLSRKKKARIRSQVTPFFAALALMTLISLCIPLRPDFSELEKRELESFPEFSFSALLSGDWFDGISLWFSDTFPGRESWVKAQSKLESFYGDREITYSGALVSLPTVEETPEPVILETVEETPEPEATPEPTPEPTPDPEDGVSFEKAASRTIGASVYFGDSAYEIYALGEVAAETYSKTLSKAADKYAEKGIRFFSMICPNSGGIVLAYDIYDQLYSVRQGDAVEAFYVNASENLIPVKIYDTLRAHNTEYLYFRTDHHWTALGAYYAYTEFCKTAGFEPVSLSEYTEMEMDPFLGSFYQHNPNDEMKDNPDTVIAYVPSGNITCQSFTVNTRITQDAQGQVHDVVVDKRGEDADRQYLCFLNGDHYLTEITNNDIEDDSCILVVKDSYANPFAVYLAAHYHTVLVMDWHYELRINEILAAYNVDDILVLSELVQAQGTDMLSNLYGDFLTGRGG